ncbi:hypothetical protein JZO78_13835 [Enterococcus ureilyticus]|uniref:hypothetical protein n=1 Tax=Enterococcus ureilyticus TaxID=1131292 RepID=UPI001A93A596|nr:hypothetical protein [Enterococcus ureilyticus]MBO0447412.1 hypothetical protein [Enterococcus ureilyticus]
MNKKVVFIVGNGFNYFLSQYVNEENKSVLLKKIVTEGHYEEDTKIWLDKLKIGLDEYCNLLDFLKLENYSETGETLLSRLYHFFKSIDNDISNNETEEYTEEINKNLEKLVVKKIDTIFKDTAILIDEKKSKKSYINTTARRIMFSLRGNFFAKNIDNLVKKMINTLIWCIHLLLRICIKC